MTASHPPPQRATAAALGAALLVLVAGCGSDDAGPSGSDPAFETVMADPTPSAATEATTPAAPASSAAPLDVCGLVAKEDAEKVVGTALDDPVPSDTSCMWTGPVTGPLAQFEIYVGPGAQKFLEIDRSIGHEFEDVPDLGDEALLEDGSVFVRAGETWVALRVVRLDALSAYREELLAVAAKVVGSL